MKMYNCTICIHSQLYSTYKRTCFLFDTFPNGDRGKAEGDYFEVPRFNLSGNLDSDASGRVATELRFLGEDEFLEQLWDVNESLPNLSAFQILQAYFREVCPTAFGDEVMSSLLNAQQSCSEYKIDISDDDVRYELLGFNMGLSDTLEAFSVITAARSAYERWDFDRMTKESKEKK
tara:strand:- start:454 stop:981 length:528 start_codon:yes stop_codon:yes gene_type:complete